MNKRGLSGVISTLLIIIISLVAITILWVVVKNLLSKGTEEEMGTGKFYLKMEIKQVSIEDDGVHITIKRNPGQGEVKGLKFYLSDGKNSESFDVEENIKELEEKTFTLDYPGILTSVSMAPKIGSSGQLSGIIDEYNVPGRETMKTIPDLLSWWRFKGNANDEMGINNGTVNGASLVEGKFGAGYKFDKENAVITVPDSESLRLENSNMSILTWIEINNNEGKSILDKTNSSTGKGYLIRYTPITPTPNLFRVAFRVESEINTLAFTSYTNNSINEWIHVAATQIINSESGKRKGRLYIDGVFDKEREIDFYPSDSSGGDLSIGTSDMNGIIDELMIFNRTLSNDEIQYIYNLDLS